MALVEASIEGAIEKIEPLGANGVQITSLGVKITFVPGPVRLDPPAAAGVAVRQKSIRSPSQRLTPADLLNTDVLPGRSYGADPIKGFTGGTVIANGLYDTDATPGVLEANHLSVEPAENVLIGALTGNTIAPASMAGTVRVNGTECVILTDARLSSNPISRTTPVYLNEFGLKILPHNLSIVPFPPGPDVPAATAVEGYFGNDGKFYAYQFEYGGPGLILDPTKPQISIERAQVRDEGTQFDIEVRGHVSTPHQPTGGPRQTIELYILDMLPGTFGTAEADWVRRSGTPLLGTLRLDFRSPGESPFTHVPPIQRWRFRASLPKSGANLLPPERIEARNLTAERAVHIDVMEVHDTDVREE